MNVAAAVGLAALIAFVGLWRFGNNLPARVIYDKPTTIWPIGVVVFASVVALVVAMVFSYQDASRTTIILATSISWYLAALGGRINSGTRLLFDRGGRAFTPTQVVTAIIAFFMLLFVFLGVGT